MNINFQNKVAIITGGSSGIGKAMCGYFSALGAQVYSTYNTNPTENFENVIYSQVNIASLESVQTFVQDIVKKTNRIDFLINNAGFASAGRVDRLSEYAWDSVIETNLKGTYAMTHAVTPHMISQNMGKIVNIASINAMRGREGTLSYNTSKAGIIALTKSVANELGMYNINVNSISPGFVYTEKQEKTPEIVKKLVLQESSLKKFCMPQDIANLAAFLCSDFSHCITGENIKIDCGQYV